LQAWILAVISLLSVVVAIQPVGRLSSERTFCAQALTPELGCEKAVIRAGLSR
jgi:hypothetical protein